MIAQYIEAFQRCYPQKRVEVKEVRVAPGDYRYKVIIDGEAGEARLTLEDMKYATQLFNRGKL